MRYTVEIPQLAALQRAFRESPELVVRESTRAGNKALVRYQGTARQEAPIDKGQLRGSLQVRPMRLRGNTLEGSMGTNLAHAIHMERGTGIYGPAKRPIRPKRAKVLAWQSGGQWHFAKSVKGSKPHWYMRTSLERNQEATIRDFGQALDNVANQLGRAI